MANKPTRYAKKRRAATSFDRAGFYKWNFKRALKGDTGSARQLIHGFCNCIEQNTAIPRSILDYLHTGFAKFLSEDEPLEKALLLTRPARRPRDVYTVDPVLAVGTLYLHIKRDGLSKERAKDRTAEGLGIPRRSLEKHDQELNLIRDYSVSELEQLTQDHQELRRQRSSARK